MTETPWDGIHEVERRADCCSPVSLRYFYHENLSGAEAGVTGKVTKEK
jgi:hypothetical protein